MREAITHEVGLKSPLHRSLADDLLQRQEYGGCLPIGDSAVRVEVQILISEARQRIAISNPKVSIALLSIITLGDSPQRHHRAVGAQNIVENLALGVAVYALIQPRILEFIGSNHAIPVLVSEFMFDD